MTLIMLSGEMFSKKGLASIQLYIQFAQIYILQLKRKNNETMEVQA